MCLGARENTSVCVEAEGREDWRRKSEDFMEKMVRFGLGNKMGYLKAITPHRNMGTAYFHIRGSMNIYLTYMNLMLLHFYSLNLLLFSNF